MRRAWKIVLGLLVAGALTLALLPWWFGALLRPIARGQGVTFSQYERVGYARFRLTDVSRNDPAAKFSARTVEADTPLRWSWRALRDADREVTVEQWKLELTGEAAAPSSKPPPAGAGEVHAQVRRTADTLARWLPRATLRDGEVRAPRAGIASLKIAELTWDRGNVTARGVEGFNRRGELVVNLRATANGPLNSTAESATAPPAAKASPAAGREAIELRLDSPADRARATLRWTGLTLTGEGTWSDQPWTLRATFPAAGWIPSDAELIAENWTLPAAHARLENHYAQLTGGARVVWREARFELTAEFRAAPKEGDKAPPIEARAKAHGDRTAITLETLQLVAPFAEAALSAPVVIPLTSARQLQPAKLNVRADLAKQPWFDAAGTLTGSIEVSGTAESAREVFRFSGEQVRFASIATRRLALAGELRWPQLQLTEFAAELDETTQVAAKGSADLVKRELERVELKGNVSAAWFERWLPPKLRWESAAFTGELHGSFAAPEHRGTAQVKAVTFAPLRPVDATLEWQGRGSAVETLSANLAAAGSSLRLAASVNAKEILVRELELRRGDSTAPLTLQAPASIGWAPALRIADLHLASDSARLRASVDGGDAAAFQVELTQLPDAWLRDWLPITGPEWTVNSLQAKGTTDGEVLAFQTTLAATAAIEPNPVLLQLNARGDASGVMLEQLEVRSPAGVLGQAKGRVPLVWKPRDARPLHWLAEGKLELEGETRPDSPLWAALAAPAGFELSTPRARIRISGTLERPTGELELDVLRLAAAEGSRWTQFPALDRLALRAHADRGSIVVDSLSTAVEGQEIRGSAKLPLDDAAWTQLLRDPRRIDWGEAEARIEIPGAELQPLAEGRPGFPLGHGKLEARLSLARGRKFSGSLKLSNALARPLPTLGVLQDIQLELALEGRRVEIRRGEAELGGETLALRGTVALDDPAAPKLDVQLSGKRLPLVRRDGMLIRADLDLTAKSPSGETPPQIGGTLTLRDSLILADLRQFIPTGVRAAERAPPYFSVSAEPFRRWTLGIDVRGERGVRLQTPVITGFATPHLRLEGNLGEPRLIGDATLESAKLLFPFATFEVQLGVVRLTQADPFHPQLTLNATARRYGYELKFDGCGPVDQPIITLSSTPALPTEQVLLMVMAGQAPTDDATPTGSSQGKRLTVLGTYLGRGLFRELGGGDDPDKITITSGEQISEQGGETYAVEYKLSPRWSLVGEYDEFDDYNAGVKWRAFTEDAADAKAKPPKR